jgi:heptosyltransferase-2
VIALPKRTLVLQPRPGIGDLIWHLPLIHALAATSAAGKLSLLTKRSTAADVLLAEDESIENLLWLDGNPVNGRRRHGGPAGFVRLVAMLRDQRMDAAIMLHQSARLAAALAAARVPLRFGYGYGSQRLWLNRGPFLPGVYAGRHPTAQAAAYAAALGLPPLGDTQQVFVAQSAIQTVLAREPEIDRCAVLGVGSTEMNRCWPPERFADLAGILLKNGYPAVLLLASAGESSLAEAVASSAFCGGRIRHAVGWPLASVVALLSRAKLFVGNDSGMLNLRAAVGGVAFGLFGTSGPLTHSTLIRPIVSEKGARAGMDSITVDDALVALAAEEELLF